MRQRYKYGIDFGTTNSSIACVMDDGNGNKTVKAFAVNGNKNRSEFIRSIVAFKDGEIIVGDGARQANASDIVTEVKTKLLARKCDDVCATHQGKKYYYSDVMAAILKYLKSAADRQKGNIVISGVVMGIPNETEESVKAVYYDALCKADFYRTREEAIEKTEFLEESVSVAMYFGANQVWQNKRAQILDFGGGTRELAVVDLKPQGLNSVGERHQVYSKSRLSTAGERITRELFLKVFLSKYSEAFFNGDEKKTVHLLGKLCDSLTDDPAELWDELKNSTLGMSFVQKMTRVKEELSFNDFAGLSMSYGETNGRCVIEEIYIERGDFETAIEGEMMRIQEKINTLLSNPEKPCPNIDMVLMAGGSSSIPSVRRLLQNRFGKDKVFFDDYHRGCYYINVMTCTALGFAYAGAIGVAAAVNDVTSFDYGFYDAVQKKVQVIIKKNTNFSDATFSPLTKESKFYCDVRQTDPKQRFFSFDLCEGERKVAHFRLDNKNGSGKYRLFFYIDAERGLLLYTMYDREMHTDITEQLLDEERSYKIVKE